jgi:hypothetical protein
MMSNEIPTRDQYARFGDKFEEPVTTTMHGRVSGNQSSAEGADEAVDFDVSKNKFN